MIIELCFEGGMPICQGIEWKSPESEEAAQAEGGRSSNTRVPREPYLMQGVWGHVEVKHNWGKVKL